MIRINLLAKGQARPRKTGGKGIILIAAIVGGVAVLGGAGFGVWKFKNSFTVKHVQQEEKQPITVKPENAPSTYSKQNIVEETVREVNDSRGKAVAIGVMTLPYADLSFAEKINYEILFARNVVSLLAKTVPPGPSIGLRSLELDNFQTVYVVGRGESQELIQEMINAIKSQQVEILPKPYSFVKPVDKNSYKFAFLCKPEFGLNLTEPVIDAPFVENGSTDSLISAFNGTIRSSGLTLVKPLSSVSAEKIGGFYRHTYQWTASGSYKNFSKLIMTVYQSSTKCAFKRIALTATAGNVLKIESQVIFTTQN
jgi:predicted RNase H-related nuclease YkuK (DUF458 family)